VDRVTKIGITLGDPAGIGPEIVAAALGVASDQLRARAVVFGDRDVLERAAHALGTKLPDVIVVGEGIGAGAIPGAPNDASGAAQVAYLEAAVAAAKRGEIAAIATAPISKTWARRAGFAFPGHTEMLAERFGVDDVAMMFAGPKLKVALATVHIPLAAVARALTTKRIRRVVELLVTSLVRDFAIAAPVVGVVGLNPHAGEGGILGDEDRTLIAPAVIGEWGPAMVTGPLVPDVAFRDCMVGRHDALVAMYHDQGLIPVKLVDFDDSVNMTLGLPIVRTSPDHGTAYDIAGKGIARATSMRRAIDLAMTIAHRRATLPETAAHRPA